MTPEAPEGVVAGGAHEGVVAAGPGAYDARRRGEDEVGRVQAAEGHPEKDRATTVGREIEVHPALHRFEAQLVEARYPKPRQIDSIAAIVEEVRNRVVSMPRSEADYVHTGTRNHPVIAGTAVDVVVPETAGEVVVPGTTQEGIVSLAASEIVVTLPPVDQVVARVMPEKVVARASVERVVTGQTDQGIIAPVANKRIVASGADDGVIARAAD